MANTTLDRIGDDAAAALALLDKFPAAVESFIKATGMSQTNFGCDATGSVDFVRLMRAGRDFRISTVRRALQFMAEHG